MEKINRNTCVLLLIVLLGPYSFGQSMTKYHALKVGDSVPDILITNILNHEANTAQISDFKDKVLLLDFWATWCESCIQNFPKAYALQKEFPEKLQVLLVNCKDTRDKEKNVRDFFEKRKSLYQFPCVVMDTVLNSLFPHHGIPHYAIIKNNIVIAITDAENINEQNIKAIIEEKIIALRVKVDNRYDPTKPIFPDTGGNFANVLYRSTLGGVTSYRNSMGYKRATGDLVAGIHIINEPLIRMFMFFNPNYSRPSTRIIYNVPNPEDYNLDSISNNWKSKHFYTYEAVFPAMKKPEAMALLNADLKRFFHLKIDSGYRETMCYVLTLNKSKLPKAADSSVRPSTNIYEKSGGPVYFINSRLDDLCMYLEALYKTPFVDETSYNKNVTLDMPANLVNENVLVSNLRQQGFILKKEKRRISFLVISNDNDTK